MTSATTSIPDWLDIDRLARTTPGRRWWLFAACHPPGGVSSVEDRQATLARFLPEQGTTKVLPEVEEMCEGCSTRYACLAEVMQREDKSHRAGHWAATTPRQRVRIRRELRRRRAAA